MTNSSLQGQKIKRSATSVNNHATNTDIFHLAGYSALKLFTGVINAALIA